MTADIENVVAIDEGDAKRVIAIQWAEGDGISGPGFHISTDGWERCVVAGCRWQYDPDSECPDHGHRES